MFCSSTVRIAAINPAARVMELVIIEDTKPRKLAQAKSKTKAKAATKATKKKTKRTQPRGARKAHQKTMKVKRQKKRDRRRGRDNDAHFWRACSRRPHYYGLWCLQ